MGEIILNYGFITVSAAIPSLKVADVTYNVENIISCIDKIEKTGPDVALFPELSITAYTCHDLFSQKTLIDSALKGLEKIIEKTKGSQTIYIIGAPLYNK